MKLRARANERGVTLIELLITLFVGSIVAFTFFQALDSQRSILLGSLDKTQSIQNGRAALSLVRRYTRLAGWGFVAQQDGTPPEGVVPIGSCAGSAEDPPAKLEQGFLKCDCNATSTETCVADEMRVAYIEPDTAARTTAVGTAASVTTAVPKVAVKADEMVFISGKCSDGKPRTELRLVETVNGDGSIVTTRAPVDAAAIAGGCPGTYDEGAMFGRAKIVDFYIDQDDPAHPRLMMRDWKDEEPPIDDKVVADYIDNLQIRYGIDTTDAPDGIVATNDWCNSLSDNTCATAKTGEMVRAARIVAVHVALVMRSQLEKKSKKMSVTDTVTLAPWNSEIVPLGQGFNRWVFRATVALRNRAL